MQELVKGYRVVARNFYGQLRVLDSGDPEIDEDATRKFVHGIINHGEQSLREEYRRQPITYFCEGSGIGRAMRAQQGAPRRIGILGLGCGTLAAYGQPGDTLRIYEINPLVLDIARTQFTYLSDTSGARGGRTGRWPPGPGIGAGIGNQPAVRHAGDGRLLGRFGAGSPDHARGFQTYFRHLKPGGILAVNITNSYLDLEPVMERAANAFDKVAMVYRYEPEPEDDMLCFGCAWTLIMDRATLSAHPRVASRRGRTAAGAPVPDLDGRFLEHVLDL